MLPILLACAMRAPAGPPAALDPALLARITAATRSAEAAPWTARTPVDWAETAPALVALALAAGPPTPPPPGWPGAGASWPWEEVALRAPLCGLYVQIGRSAEALGTLEAPYFAELDGVVVNYFHWLAASMALADPALPASLPEGEARDALAPYLDRLATEPSFPRWTPAPGS